MRVEPLAWAQWVETSWPERKRLTLQSLLMPRLSLYGLAVYECEAVESSKCPSFLAKGNRRSGLITSGLPNIRRVGAVRSIIEFPQSS